jgi:hypothetical protein
MRERPPLWAAAIDAWTGNLGIGPLFRVEHAHTKALNGFAAH